MRTYHLCRLYDTEPYTFLWKIANVDMICTYMLISAFDWFVFWDDKFILKRIILSIRSTNIRPWVLYILFLLDNSFLPPLLITDKEYLWEKHGTRGLGMTDTLLSFGLHALCLRSWHKLRFLLPTSKNTDLEFPLNIVRFPRFISQHD